MKKKCKKKGISKKIFKLVKNRVLGKNVKSGQIIPPPSLVKKKTLNLGNQEENKN